MREMIGYGIIMGGAAAWIALSYFMALTSGKYFTPRPGFKRRLLIVIFFLPSMALVMGIFAVFIRVWTGSWPQ
jgi:hypothetical protein